MYKRRLSTEARVGNIGIGGQNPIRIQSMATVDTNDTEGCVVRPSGLSTLVANWCASRPRVRVRLRT